MKSSPKSRAWYGRCSWRTPSPSSSASSSSGWTLMPEAPQAGQATFNFKAAITQMVQRNASDLLLKVGRPATIRVNGELVPLDSSPLKPEELKSLAEQIMTPRQVKEFAEHKEADFAIGVPGVGRLRTNVYQQRGTVAFAFRAIPYEVKTIHDLNLPPVLEEIGLRPRGLVLVTGVTGSGKSTALAAMINHVNTNRRVNIITIEDPIEFLHRDNLANISQREVGNDTLSFNAALRHVLRQAPDVILIGEIRDMETLDTALKAADTGHLVFSTLHTTDATQTINRVISFFPPHQHDDLDPRHGDARHGAESGGHRAPGVLDAPHHGRDADDQPGHLVLPAASARRDPPPPVDGAPGDRVAAARAAQRRQGSGARVRGADQYGGRAGEHARSHQVA